LPCLFGSIEITLMLCRTLRLQSFPRILHRKTESKDNFDSANTEVIAIEADSSNMTVLVSDSGLQALLSEPVSNSKS